MCFNQYSYVANTITSYKGTEIMVSVDISMRGHTYIHDDSESQHTVISKGKMYQEKNFNNTI